MARSRPIDSTYTQKFKKLFFCESEAQKQARTRNTN
jgi:hypothetical protein